MKIHAIEREIPDVKAEQFPPFLKAEARRVWFLYQAGTIRELYFRQDQSTAVIILECKDLQEAEDNLSTLPLVREGLIRFEMIPLKPDPGFSRLFAE